MKSILCEQRKSSILAAVVTVGMGVLLVCWPDRSVDFLCLLLGAAVLVTGVIYILGWVARRKQGVPTFFVLPGIILAGLGLWLMTGPGEVVLLIQIIFGAVLVFHGLVDLQSALVLLRQKWNRWWLDLLMAVLTVALGVLILANPFGTFRALIVLIGLSLVYDGVSDLVLIWRVSKAVRRKERELQDQAVQTENTSTQQQ